MILYVLAVWLCAVGCVLLAELLVLSLPGIGGGPRAASPQQQPLDPALGLGGQPPEQAPLLIIALSLLLGGLVLGYLIEQYLQPVQRLYRALQKAYPGWYRRLPAAWRELLLALGLTLLLLLTATGLSLAGLLSFGLSLPAALGLGLGLSLPPMLRLRRTLNDDRPETGPQALLHQVVPEYSVDRALAVGQIYLRLLLPVFSLFCMLVLPLALQQLELSAVETLLLMLGLVAGAGLGWLSHRESQLDFARFRANLYQLCALSLLASAFLLFGVASGNLAELLLMSAFSGYLAAMY